mgnify:CR=1 FL=1
MESTEDKDSAESAVTPKEPSEAKHASIGLHMPSEDSIPEAVPKKLKAPLDLSKNLHASIKRAPVIDQVTAAPLVAMKNASISETTSKA